MGFLEAWELTYDEINELLTDNPSLRSFLSGYAAEMKCRSIWFEDDERATDIVKDDDHDRSKKGDIAFTYRGQRFTVEVKSLQTNNTRIRGGVRTGNFQCDASDRRWVKFADGSTIETTSLLVGEFDILAVNLHAFYDKWVFAFAKNSDLPHPNGLRGKSRDYTPYQREHLLLGTMPMSDPPVAPYWMEPWSLLDELIEERAAGATPEPVRVLDASEEPTLYVPEV